MESIVGMIVGIFGALTIIGIYFLPGIVAGKRNHHQAGAIFILNLLLGWTLLGWVFALVWANTAIRKDLQ